MKPKKGIASIMFVCFWLANSQAQTVQPLQEGDACPDVFLENIINYPVKEARLSDFKGKWTLLYFWGLGCKSCIESMPKIDSLQKNAADQVNIFPVTYHSKAEIENFWNTSPGIKSRNIPLPAMVMGDSILHTYFPHRFVPILVWLDPDHVVKKITWGSYLTDRNIRLMLSGENPDWLPRVEHTRHSFAYDSLMLEPRDNGAGLPAKKYYSAVTSYLNGVALTSKRSRDTVKNILRYCIYNQSVPALYHHTLRNTELYGLRNRIVLEGISDSSKYFHLDKQVPQREWRRYNAYCYEAVLPVAITEKAFYTVMRNDLDKFFGLESRMEKRTVSCMILVEKEKKEPSAEFHRASVKQITLSDLIKSINQQIPESLTELDKGLDSSAVILYSADLTKFGRDLKVTLQVLRENGYDLVRDRQEVAFLVISERG